MTTHSSVLTRLASIIALALTLSLARGVSPAVPTAALSPDAGAQASDSSLTVPPDYRITTGDQLDFQIFNETDISTTQRVSAAGDIRLPLIGTVILEGLTLRDAEKKLEGLYVQGGFYVKPQVILSVKQYMERSISVLGQVNKPDRIVFPVETLNIGIVRALTLSGGLTRIAKTDAVIVTRRSSDGKETRMVVNVSDYLDPKTAATKEEFKLLPGDIVYVPERNF